MAGSPIILSKSELVEMRKACVFAAKMLNHLGKMIEPGISTLAISKEAEAFGKQVGALHGPHTVGFPQAVCTSVNEVVCHGIPNNRHILQEGDIVNVDVSPIVGGFFGDTSRTFCVGEVSPKAKKLVRTTYECMMRGINEVAPGKRIGDIGAAIQEHAEANGYGVVREFVGHGIGRVFHGEPQIPHYGRRGFGKRLMEGMTFTIEPMINIGGWKTKMLDDGWTAITADGTLSAQFEHTITVTSDGFEILTLDPDK